MLKGPAGRVLTYGGIFVAAALIQSAWLVRLQLWGAVFDPLLPLVVGIGIFSGSEAGAVAGISAGLLVDLLGGATLGLHGLGLMVVGFAAGLFERSIYLEDPLLPAVATFAATVAAETLVRVVVVIAHLGPVPWPAVVWEILAQGALNSALAPFAFRLVRTVEERFRKRYEEG
ncbi:MAG TPA: rod shape-determining protein MreD [bacterium]|nr:rod shape-determining protein MreD [bacterium]